ncbi:hypothetical protein K438DRAFT_2151052 [Mycena galopus ATCC 62051]|nr:hypothetical protein K438DRAFT_2151052 [Mycena galopus ATCC 62051]
MGRLGRQRFWSWGHFRDLRFRNWATRSLNVYWMSRIQWMGAHLEIRFEKTPPHPRPSHPSRARKPLRIQARCTHTSHVHAHHASKPVAYSTPCARTHAAFAQSPSTHDRRILRRTRRVRALLTHARSSRTPNTRARILRRTHCVRPLPTHARSSHPDCEEESVGGGGTDKEAKQPLKIQQREVSPEDCARQADIASLLLIGPSGSALDEAIGRFDAERKERGEGGIEVQLGSSRRLKGAWTGVRRRRPRRRRR